MKLTYFLSIVHVVSCLPLCMNKLLSVRKPFRVRPLLNIPLAQFFITTV